jgi:YD repeat-containing protein
MAAAYFVWSVHPACSPWPKDARIAKVLGRLWRIVNAANQAEALYGYDPQGNLKSRTDYADADAAYNRPTAYAYDAL